MNKKSINIILNISIVFVSLFIVNFLLSSQIVRLDFTEGRIHTLSPGTREIVSAFDDRVNITIYFSENLPSYLKSVERSVVDMLADFRVVSRGRITVRRIAPETDPETEQKVQQLGIPKIQMNVFDRDKAEMRNGYLGIAISYGGRHEVLPVVQNINNLEYDLAVALKKVTTDVRPVIGYMELEGTPKLVPPSSRQMQQQQRNQSEVEIFRQMLSESYEVRVVNPRNENMIDPDITTLVIVAPSQIDERTMFEIDQFVLRGGNLLIFENSFTLMGQFAQPKDPQINRLLENYGLKIGAGMVADQASERVAFGGSGMFQMIMDYPFFVRILPQGFNQDVPITATQQSFVMPWSSPIEVLGRENVKYDTLFTSSSQTMISTQLNLDPQQNFSWNTQYVPLAVMARGNFESKFDRYVPYDENDISTLAILDSSIAASAIIVIPSSEIIKNQVLQRFQNNIPLLMNMIDFVNQDFSLISIRARQVLERPLMEEVTPRLAGVLRVINIALLPIALVAFAVVFNYKRKRLNTPKTENKES